MMKVLFCIFSFYLSTCSDVCFAGPGPGPDPIRQIIQLVPKIIQLVPKVLRYPEVISEVVVIQNGVGGPVLLTPPSSPLPSAPTPPPSPMLCQNDVQGLVPTPPSQGNDMQIAWAAALGGGNSKHSPVKILVCMLHYYSA